MHSDTQSDTQMDQRAEKPSANPELERLAKQDYKYGFVTEIEEDRIAPGLTEDVVRLISQKKREPECSTTASRPIAASARCSPRTPRGPSGRT